MSKSTGNYGTRTNTDVVQSRILGEVSKKLKKTCVPMTMKTIIKVMVGPSETTVDTEIRKSKI